MKQHLITKPRYASSIVVLCLSLLPTLAAAEQGERTRNCPPGTPRDPLGYCRLPAPTPTKQPRASRPTPSPPASEPATPAEPTPVVAPQPTVDSPPSAAVVPPEQPTPAPSSRRSRLIGPWVLLGSGLAIAVTGTVLYGLAYSAYGEHERFDSMQELDDWAARVDGRALAGDLLVGIGAAAVIAGLVWLLLTRRALRQSAQAPTSRLSVAPATAGERSTSCTTF